MNKNIEELLKNKNQGIKLDMGCGANKQGPDWVGIDYRQLPGVDIVHDLEEVPYPLPSGCASVVASSHVLEHISPHKGTFINVMNEIWRLLKENGEFIIAVPYATSPGMYRDPSHCLVDGAEVLTKDGFKLIQDVEVGEEILTLNMETEETEYSKCVNVINEDYEGQIVKFENRATSIAVTPNHDLISKWRGEAAKWEKAAAETFFERTPFGRIGLATIPKWKGDEKEKVEISRSQDEHEGAPTVFDTGDFMELLGWFLSEGCLKRPNGDASITRSIAISQNKIVNLKKYERISTLLKRMGFEINEYEHYINIKSRSLYDYLEPLGKQDVRYIPLEYKTLSVGLLLRLLESLRMGDGEWHHPKQDDSTGYVYTTISEKLASDVHEIALKCGFRASVYLRKGKEFFSPNRGKYYTRRDQFRVSVCPISENICYPKPTTEHYDGKIVCVTVEKNNTILTRYNGHVIWMGNCNFLTEETWEYFDPISPIYQGSLYGIYAPLPWKIKYCTWDVTGNMETVLIKRRIDKSYNVYKGFLDALKDK